MNTEDLMNMYRHDLGSFTQFGFRELHPHIPYQHNWHIDAIAHALSEVERGNIRRLIITLPPRALKSHCVSVSWPAFLLGRNPRLKLLYLHAGKALGQELENSCQALMSSRRYRALFPSTVIRQQKQKLLTGFGGYRQFMPVMGRLTGLGADIIVIDDSIGAVEARDDHERAKVNAQFDDNIWQRLNSKSKGAIVIVMQRMHEDDLVSHVLKKDESWVHLNMPAIAIADEVWNLPYGKTHFRKKGEVLHPARESRDQLVEILHAIGGYTFSLQYLQALYKPKFGMYGKGALWLTPMRDGIFYDERQNSGGLHGFYHFSESSLILPKIFGIGEDPYPDNMRNTMTLEEFEIACQVGRENLEKHHRETGLL